MVPRALSYRFTAVTLGLLFLQGSALGSAPGDSRPPTARSPAPGTVSPSPKRSPREIWEEQADKWHKDPLSLQAPAFAIAENLYYVGNKQFSSHLLVGKKQIVLIDTPYPEHFDMLLKSIRSVGVDPKKIALILHTHGHYDHYGATRRMVDLSGARTAMHAADLKHPTRPHVIEPGIRGYCQRMNWPYEPFDVDVFLNHGDTIDIGGTMIHCHHTPGHTKGTMTFTFDILIDGQKHTAVLWGGPGTHMLKPSEADDWTRSLAYLKALQADVPLGCHPFINDTLGKYAKRQQGGKPDPFIDPAGFQKFVAKQDAEFHRLMDKISQQQEGRPQPGP